MDIPIEIGFKVGGAIGGGDCFFDAVSQGLNQLKTGIVFSIGYLRQICKHYAEDICLTKGSWLKAALNHEGQTIEYYITNIKYGSMDFCDGKTPNGLKHPIWGRPEIEGRMICDFCKIKLHLVEKHVIDIEETSLDDVGKNVSKIDCVARNTKRDGSERRPTVTQLTETPPIGGNKISRYNIDTQPAECEMQACNKKIWIHQIVDKAGSKSVGEVRYDADDTVHILNEGDLHFKPILRGNPQTPPSTSGAVCITQEHLHKSERIDSKHGTIHSIPPDKTNQIAIEDFNLNMKQGSEKPKSEKPQVVDPLHLHSLDTVYAKVFEDIPFYKMIEALSRSQDNRMYVISGIIQSEAGMMEDELLAKVLHVRDPRIACEIRRRVYNRSIAFLPNKCKEDAVQTFRKMCYENRDKVVYWVEIASGKKAQLLQVCDPNFYLKRQFCCKGKRRSTYLCDEATFCKKNTNVIILTYKSGMGMTTTLANLASQLMYTYWVIRVNLEDCADAITAIPLQENSNAITCEDVYDFLSQVEGTGFPNHDIRELFCRKLRENVCKPPHILILFDGYAKVRSYQEVKVVKFFKFLKTYTSAKIWVTTTPEKETYLEMILHVYGTWLKEVSTAEQVQYLCNFWKVQFGLTCEKNILVNRLELYAKDLLHKAMQMLNQITPRLANSPLSLRMLAEGFQSEALKCCQDQTSKCCVNNFFKLTDIYKEFIDKRCRINLKEETWYNNHQTGDCLRYLKTDCSLRTLQQMLGANHDQEIRKTVFNIDFRLAKDSALEGSFAKACSTLQKDVQGRTAFHLAAQKGLYDFVSYLLDNRYDVFRCDASGKTTLHYAAMSGHYHIITLVTSYIADLDINDHIFATTLNTSVVIGDSIFQDSKYAKSRLVAWVNKEDNHGKTCLDYAVSNGDWRSCCTLMLNGASIRDLGKDKKKKLLAYITDVSVDSHYPLYALLLADVPNVINELADQIPHNQVWKDFCNFCAIDPDYLTLLKRAFYQGHVGVIDAIFGRIKVDHVKSKIFGFIDSKGTMVEIINCNGELSDCECLNAVRYCVEFHKKTYYESGMKLRNAKSAARRGHIQTLKYYMEKTGYDWVKPFVMQEAIDTNNFFIVDYLWKNYRNEIESCPPYHDTVLHIAAKKGTLKLVQYFVCNGADVNALNQLGDTPAHHAANSSHFDVLQYLQSNGSHFDMRDYCERRLNEVSTGNMWYDAAGEVEMWKYLLDECKPSFDWKESKCGELIWEVKLGNVNGVDEDGTTILHKAAAMMPSSFLRYLLARGADVYPTNAKGESVLHFAAKNEKSHEEVAKILLENGAIYDMKDFESKRTASDYMKLYQNTSAIPLLEFIASMFSNMNQVKFTNLDLKNQDAVFNARNHKLNTVLHLAADAHRKDVVEFVLNEDTTSRRADCLNSANEWLNTPLHVACSKGNIGIVKLLLRKGAIFDSTNCWDQTPKELAGESGHKAVVQILRLVEDMYRASKRNETVTVEKGIGKGYVDVKDKFGKTMLHWASKGGHKDMAELLLKNGANAGARDVNGWTPLHYAAIFGRKQMCVILFQYGAMFDSVNGERLTAKDVDESGSCLILNSASCLFADIKDDYPQAVLQFLEEIERNMPDYLLAVISVRDSRGYTLLHVAARGGHCDVTRFLLKLGVAYNAKTLNGETPETLCPNKSVKLLMKVIDQLFNWKRKLMYTLREIEDYLEELKIIRDVRDVHGRSILHAAADVKPLDYFRLKFFVKHGANVNARDRKGRCVLDYAIHFENLELVMFLLKNGANVSWVTLENENKLFSLAKNWDRQDITDFFLFMQNNEREESKVS